MFRLLLFLTIFSATILRAQNQWNTPKAGNPIVPGYFADPTIRKFGDTYYIYATTDGTGNGYGPAQVWVSKDFINWRNVTMNWPTTEVVWAPDVVQQPDGTFRYYYCTPCEVRVGESTSPTGPWVNRLGKSDAVLVPDRFVHNAITLDPQLFRDDDGSEYLYFGTWGIYKGFGCGVAKLSHDGKSFTEKKLIENTEIIDFFEAPFVFKKDGVYYFTYSSGSCHDDTYRVQYATSTTGPMGPFTYRGCILSTNADGTVHGPGHHSILIDGDDYYIVYHRHNIPRAIHGFHRQLCIDRLQFNQSDASILPVVPTHQGVIPQSLLKKQNKQLPNLAFGANVTASSTYSDDFLPQYAVDDNNATLWRATSPHQPAWLQIDFGRTIPFNEIFTQFEYATFFYQYKIEISDDANQWTVYADRSDNTTPSSPMIDTGEARARYIRITILDTQKNGHFPAIWNVKVYRATRRIDPVQLLPPVSIDESSLLQAYPRFHSKDIEPSQRPHQSATEPILQLDATSYDIGQQLQGVPVVPQKGKKAFFFDGTKSIHLDAPALHTLRYNAPYTITAWVLNPTPSSIETVAQLNSSPSDLATVELRNGTSPTEGIVAHNATFENAGAPHTLCPDTWQHWTITFDGFNERIYCDGTLLSVKNIFLMLRPQGPVTIGTDARGTNPFTGYLHSFRLYDYPLTPQQIDHERNLPTDIPPQLLTQLASQSPLHTLPLKATVTHLTPTLVTVTINTTNQQSLPLGILTYDYGNKRLLSTPVSYLTLPQGTHTITVTVSDIFGNTPRQLIATIPPSTNNYTDLARPLLKDTLTHHNTVTLASSHTNLSTDPTSPVPMLLADVDGDFVIQCRITDLTGLPHHSTPAYNEGGILLRQLQPDGTQHIQQLGVFPAYNCGNMITSVTNHGRPQSPNNLGWNFHPYMAIIHHSGTSTFLTSPDGIQWEPHPSSTAHSTLIHAPHLQAGIYQTTYSDNSASVTFSDFHIWKRR